MSSIVKKYGVLCRNGAIWIGIEPKQRRPLHLANYAKKFRVRKKNARRMRD